MEASQAFEKVCEEELLSPEYSSFTAKGGQVYLAEKVINLYEGKSKIKELVPRQFFVLPSGLKGVFRTDEPQTLKYASFSAVAGQLLDNIDEWSNFLLKSAENYFVDIPKEAEHTVVQFKAGEVLIEQGAEDKDVYMMMSGEAEVLINEFVIGKVYAQEIFGALAGLTDMARTATIKATKPGEALSVKHQDFSSLLGHKPAITRKLINDLARALVSTNNEVVTLQKLMKVLSKDGQSVLGLT